MGDIHWISGHTSGGYTSTWCGRHLFNVARPGEIQFTVDRAEVTCKVCIMIKPAI